MDLPKQFCELFHGQTLCTNQTNDVRIFQFPDLLFKFSISRLELADLILLCEEKFDIEIGDDDYRKFVTVGDVVNYLSSVGE